MSSKLKILKCIPGARTTYVGDYIKEITLENDYYKIVFCYYFYSDSIIIVKVENNSGKNLTLEQALNYLSPEQKKYFIFNLDIFLE